MKITLLPMRCRASLVFLFVLLLMTSSPIDAQNLVQGGFCATDSIDQNKLEMPESLITGDCYPDYPGPYYIRVYVHVVKDDNCNGGQDLKTIRSAMRRMENNFAPHNIFFVWDECEIEEHCYSETAILGYVGLQLACIPTNAPCLRQFNHNNGIDIYFGVNDVLIGDGGVSIGSIPSGTGRAIMIAGQFDRPPYPYIVNTNVLSHEMGHALGLFHTFQDWADCPDGEYVDGSNCEACGDLVCDTPADPYGGDLFDTDPNTCEYDTQGATDPHGDPYDPDELNYMSYTHADCLHQFSSCQGERMRYIIGTSGTPGGANSGNIADRLYNFDQTSPTIANNTTWDPATVGSEVTINGNLTVASGNTLTIGAGTTLRFYKNAELIIEPNATVILYGTLTDFCGQGWLGVEVQGSGSGQSQYPINGQRAQGRIITRDGALIENARVGIKLWGPTFTDTGGQVSCSGTTFKNCHVSVEFPSYQNFWPFSFPAGWQGQPRDYVGTISRCTFLVDEDYNDLLPFFAFIQIIRANGVKIYGSTFNNTMNMDGDDIGDWGYGILAFDTKFTVQGAANGNTYPPSSYTRCEFNGLGYGIYAGTAAKNQPYHVTQSDFTKCFVGLRNRRVSGATILFNKFNLGQLPSTDFTTEQSGICFEYSINGFTCQQNEFLNPTGNSTLTTIGIFSKETGEFNKLIRKNTFDGLTIGNLANGINGASSPDDIRGLNYLCNTNDEVQAYGADFDVATGLIRVYQGEDNFGGYDATGNSFSYTGTDFVNSGGNALEYFYNPFGASEPPVTYSGIGISIADANSCPTLYCEPPCPLDEDIEIVKEKFYYGKENYQIIRQDYDLNPTKEKLLALGRQQQIMDEASYKVVVHQLNDTLTFHEDTLLTWIDNLGSFPAQIWKATQYLDSDHPAFALDVLEDIPLYFELSEKQLENLQYMEELASLLVEKPIYNLQEVHLEVVKEVVEVEGEAGAWAENILTLYGYHFPPVYATSLRTHERPPYENQSDTKDQQSTNQYVTVQPNPARDHVDFQLNPTHLPKQFSILVRDINGRMVFSRQLSAEQSNIVTWQTNQALPGFYIYQILSEDQLLDSGKIIVNKQYISPLRIQ